jgi:hypothetical protein
MFFQKQTYWYVRIYLLSFFELKLTQSFSFGVIFAKTDKAYSSALFFIIINKE